LAQHAGFIFSELAMNIYRTLLAASLATALLASASAQATVSVYTTQASYLAAVSAPGTDSFDSLNPVALNYFLPSPAARTAGPYSYTASSPGAFYTLPNTATDVWLSALTAGAAITLNNFSSSVRGVGGLFFVVNGGDAVAADRSLNITTLDGSGSTVTAWSNPTGASFLGLVSNGPITSVTISLVGAAAGRYVTLNDITLGAVAAVPEPSAVLLWLAGLAGLAGLGLTTRRRSPRHLR
jgi:PEP-CTERM motif